VTSTADVIETADDGPAAARRLARPEPVTRTVIRRSMDGTELGEVELDPQIFGIEPNEAVLHQVVTAQLAAARAGTQSTKTRAEVRGGGAKPYRQKGTGRARQGSTRSPQFIGGGVALGPKPRSYAQKTPKKMVRLALHSALSDRAARSRVVVIDAWAFEVPRTKDAIAVLRGFGLRGRVLLVLGDGDGYAERSFANLQEVRSITIGDLSAYEILVNDWVVFSDETLPGTANRLDKADTAEADAEAETDAEAEADAGASDADSGSDDDTDDGDAGSDEAATDEGAS
jgi:large subunit ribosomal protein L4